MAKYVVRQAGGQFWHYSMESIFDSMLFGGVRLVVNLMYRFHGTEAMSG